MADDGPWCEQGHDPPEVAGDDGLRGVLHVARVEPGAELAGGSGPDHAACGLRPFAA